MSRIVGSREPALAMPRLTTYAAMTTAASVQARSVENVSLK